MGFNIERRTAKLVLHEAYEGAWIRVLLDVPMSTSFQLVRLGRGLTDQPTVEDAASMFDFFAEHFLTEWNLEDGGQAIPTTAEGMQRLPVALAAEIIKVTLEAVANPPAPLSGPSSNGNTSAVNALPNLLKHV